MSETSNTDLIAEAEARVNANRIGLSWARETDKDLLVIKRLATALGAAATTLTETETELQASRGREKALRAQITAALVFADEAGEINFEEDNYAAGANAVAMLLEGYPSPALEAVKAAAWDEGSDAAWDTAEWMNKSIRDYPRPSFHTNPYRPVSTEGESRG